MAKQTIQEFRRDFKSIAEDYQYNADVMNPEPERVNLVKEIIHTRLTESERIVILLYADCHSYRKLGRRLGLSHGTVATEVRRIRTKILEAYKEMTEGK